MGSERTLIIGLCGGAGSGKTTAANYLARTYGAKVYAFATPLKQIIQRAFELPDACLWGTQAEKETAIPWLGVSGRWLMQRLGTQGVRAVLGDDFWAKTTLTQIERDRPRLAVIEDVRFISEGNAVRWWRDDRVHDNALLWTLYTPDPETSDDGTHQSESEWSKISADYFITPSKKSISELYACIDRACAFYDVYPVLHSVEAP